MDTLPALMARAIDAGLLPAKPTYPWSLSFSMSWREMQSMSNPGWREWLKSETRNAERRLIEWHGLGLLFSQKETHNVDADIYTWRITAHREEG